NMRHESALAIGELGDDALPGGKPDVHIENWAEIGHEFDFARKGIVETGGLEGDSDALRPDGDGCRTGDAFAIGAANAEAGTGAEQAGRDHCAGQEARVTDKTSHEAVGWKLVEIALRA